MTDSGTVSDSVERKSRTSTAFLDSAGYLSTRRWVGVGLSVALIALLLAWPRLTNFYSWNDAYYNGLVASAAISAILTISLNLCMGYGGLLSIMHTGLELLGAYAVATLLIKGGVNWIIGLVVAVLLGALFSVLVMLISLRATYLYLGMITLAANLILVEAGRVAEPLTGGVVGIAGVRPSFGGEVMSQTTFYFVILLLLALVYVVQRNLVRSGVGRASMAVRESSDTASAMGIWPARTKIRLFAIAGGIAGLAGGLYALQLGFINPDVGLLENGLIFFVGLFLGGIGTLLGPLLGVGAIAIVVELIKGYARYSTLILGLVLLTCMMVIPRGLVGTWSTSRWGRNPMDDVGDDSGLGRVPDTIRPVQPPAGGAPALAGVELVKHFGGVKAVDGINIAVQTGTVHGIIGPNGSGKSTLVACLTRFHKLDDGQVLIGGEPAPMAAHAVAEAGVARVFQIPHLFERVSVLDNVLTGMRMRERYTWIGAVLRSPGFRRQDRAQRAEARQLLAFAGLGVRADWPAGALSHGQKRLLEVVRAVATRPKVLILDEPATGLTVTELEALSHLCRSLAEHGVAVILIEHNIDFVMTVCSTITVIEGGRVIAEGDPATVRSSPAVIEAYLGRPDLIEEGE